jgi:Reverse transcriptase (RNA-dependent DNA polymerase)
MKHTIAPTIEDLSSESVLFQAWKKTEAYIRSHNWYADTLELDWQALRLPDFIAGIQRRIRSGTWKLQPLRMVPAPKSQRWSTLAGGEWKPAGENVAPKIRPLAHVGLQDQVLCTAIMLCLADRVENEQGDPTADDSVPQSRKRVCSYGHRLFCRADSEHILRHSWAAKKLYRQFSADYRRFLARPDKVAVEAESSLTTTQCVAIVSADFSRFYDRVRPALMHESIRALQRTAGETAFFDFAVQLFDWEWAQEDQQRANKYGQEAKLNFARVALPQGLVAAGFFANVVLLRFDERLLKRVGRPINMSPGVTLLDVCRYVDDIRLVLRVPKSTTETALKQKAADWLSKHVEATARGLKVENEKTQVLVRGGTEHSAVPQSRAAERIQHAISEGFDFEQGMHIIGALEGFVNTQHRYSPDAQRQTDGLTTILRGISDMRDDTAARFAAARYRNTFRSLRPLLDAGLSSEDGDAGVDDDEDGSAGFSDAVITRAQFDERGLLFARDQLAAWEENPAHVRLMRIAVDLFPCPEFCARILRLLRPAWAGTMTDARRREVMHYCLAELFRAGATETGIVRDLDELPDKVTGADVVAYHQKLLEGGREILRAAAEEGGESAAQFPWYLLQQVMLYLATHQESLEDVELSALPGADGALRRYVAMYHFYAADAQPADAGDKARFMILQARGFGQQKEMVSRAAKHPSQALLRAFMAISPSFAESVWQKMALPKRRALAAVANETGLVPPPSASTDGLVCAADHAGLRPSVWQEEYNLVVLTRDLLKARRKTRSGVLTPWRVFLRVEEGKPGPVSGRVVPGSLEIRESNGGETLFALPDWCETNDEKLRVEVGQVIRYLLTGSAEYFSPVARCIAQKNLPQYRRVQSNWELGRYGSFNGRTAFGPDWVPLSAWAENLLISLLRWPGCGVGQETEFTVVQWLKQLKARINELEAMRGSATGMLFLEQEAKWPHKKQQKTDRPLRIAIVQSVVPDVKDFTAAGTADLRLNGPVIRQKHRNHLRRIIAGLHKMLAVRVTHLRGNPAHQRPHLDWVIFPELALHPDDVNTMLLPIVRRYKCIVLAGLVYHPLNALEAESPLINSALWLIPEWSASHGLQVRRVEQGKAHLAPDEAAAVGAAVIEHRPAQWIVRYHWAANEHSRPLHLSAAVCYDATDTALAHDLRNRNDVLAICALNQDVPTYDNLAETLNYLLFQGVIVANNGSHGGSNFFAPFRESYRREIIHFHGQEQAAIAFAEINPAKFITRPESANSKSHPSQSTVSAQPDESEPPIGKWKKQPAGRGRW